MHTIIVLAIGFILLGLCALTGRVLGDASAIATAALVYLPLWLVGAGINMYLGVTRAGYSVADEVPIFFLVFAVPAAAAVVLWWMLSSSPVS
jgi:hypothetical protein